MKQKQTNNKKKLLILCINNNKPCSEFKEITKKKVFFCQEWQPASGLDTSCFVRASATK